MGDDYSVRLLRRLTHTPLALKDTLGDKLYDAYISSMLTPFSIDEVRLMERKTLYQVSTKCGNDKTFYRFGFNGKEQDPEFKGKHNVQDYGFRMNDTRYGRFFTVDPLRDSYPFYTPYAFAGNTPIQAIDLDGLEPCKRPTQDGELQDANDVNTGKHRIWMGQVASDGATTWSDQGDCGQTVIIRPTKSLITAEVGAQLIGAEYAFELNKVFGFEFGIEQNIFKFDGTIGWDPNKGWNSGENEGYRKGKHFSSPFFPESMKDKVTIEYDEPVNVGGGLSLVGMGYEKRREFDVFNGRFTDKITTERDASLGPFSPFGIKAESSTDGTRSLKMGIPEEKKSFGLGYKLNANVSLNFSTPPEIEKDASTDCQ